MGLTTAGNFIIIYFIHETLARQQGISYITAWRWFYPCPPVAYWDNPSRNASPRRHHGPLVSSADQKEDLERQVRLKNKVGQRFKW
jgi:hypothetical protein